MTESFGWPRVFCLGRASLVDAFAIIAYYSVLFLIFKRDNPFTSKKQIGLFVGTSLLVSFLWEKYALATGSWSYTSSMPLIFGVGLSPLTQIATTGLVTFYLIFHLSSKTDNPQPNP